MTRTSLLIAAPMLLVGTEALAQHSSADNFEAWRTARERRWVGDVTWIADWPGLGKKGDKITGYSEIRAAADGHVLIGQFFGGSGTNHWITYYDAGAGEIRSTGSDSGGTTWTCVISKDGRQWKSRCSGSLADGTKTEGDHTLTISDGGSKHSWSGSTKFAGEPVDELQDVWRRVGR